MQIVVIGAGASGIIAALKLSEKHKVILLEKNDKCGKKILITGNGHSNYWNANIDTSRYETDNYEILAKILARKAETYEFLKALGLYPLIKDGYYYPHSSSAFSVQALFKRALEARVEVIYKTEVLEVKHNQKYQIITNNGIFEADKLILALGSKACPKSGSDGKVYEILSSLGFKINPVLPALVQLKVEAPFLKEWEGIRLLATVTLFLNNKILKKEKGEIQLTNYGVSGIPILNLSASVSKLLAAKQVFTLELNFFEEDFYNWMEANAFDFSLEDRLESLFNYKLMYLFLSLSAVSPQAKWKNLEEKSKRKLANLINHFCLKVVGTNDFSQAQVATGGLSLNLVNPVSMETTLKDLYVIGEALDVNGECGGFNLAFAFITGFIAGEGIK